MKQSKSPYSYQDIFTKLESYILQNKNVRLTDPSIQSKRYNAIIEKMQQEKTNKKTLDKQRQEQQKKMVTIFNAKEWNPQFQNYIKSFFKTKTDLAIYRFKQFFQAQDIYDSMIKALKYNQNCPHLPISKQNIKMNFECILKKINFYQTLINIIISYPSECNNKAFQDISSNEEFGLLPKKMSQDINCLRNTLSIIDKYIQQCAPKNTIYSNSNNTLFTHKMVNPLLELKQENNFIKSCLLFIKAFDYQSLKSAFGKKNGGSSSLIRQIANEQQKIHKILDSINKQIQQMFQLTRYPNQFSKNQHLPINIDANMQEVNKKMKIMNQIIIQYCNFANEVSSIQIISKKIQNYDPNSVQGLFKKRTQWKKQLKSCSKVILSQVNSLTLNQNKETKKELQNLGVSHQFQKIRQQNNQLKRQIKGFRSKLKQNEQQINNMKKSGAELKADFQNIVQKISQITNMLNIQMASFTQKQIPIVSLSAIVRKLNSQNTTKQRVEQLSIQLERSRSKYSQLQAQRNKLNEQLSEAKCNKDQLQHKYLELNKKKQKCQQQKNNLQQQKIALKSCCDKYCKQMQQLKRQIEYIKESKQSKQLKYQLQAEQPVQINLQSSEEFMKQELQEASALFISIIGQFEYKIHQKDQTYSEKLSKIQLQLQKCKLMLRSKKDHNKQLKEELDQTRRQNSIRETNQQQENIKINNLIIQLSKRKQEINQLNRQIYQQKRQIKNLACDLQIERESVNNLNLQVQRYALQLQMVGSSQNTNHYQESNVKAFEETIEAFKLQQQVLKSKLNQTEFDQAQLKKQLIVAKNEKQKVLEDLKKQKKINQELSEKIKRQRQEKFRLQGVQNIELRKISPQHQKQFKLQKQFLKKSYLLKFNPKNQEEPSSVCLAYIDTLFQGDLLYDLIQYKYRILSHLQKITTSNVQKTKLIYTMDPLNLANFHKYIDGVKNLLTLVKTKQGQFLVGFYLGTYGQIQMRQPGILISVNKNESYTLKEPINNKKFRGMVYDPYYIIYGNAELRIRSGQHSFFSNFGISNSYYNNRNVRLMDFVGEDNHDIEIVSYEIYSIHFEHKEEERQQ